MACPDGDIKIFDHDGPLFSLKGHTGSVQSVVFGPDPAYPFLVSGGEDNTVRVWMYQNTSLLDWQGHPLTQRQEQQPDNEPENQSELRDFQVSPDGKALVQVERDPDKTDRETAIQTENQKYMDVVKLWQKGYQKPMVLQKQEGITSTGLNVSFSPDSQTLAIAAPDGKVTLWNQNGKTIAQLPADGQTIYAIQFNRDGNTLMLVREQAIERWQWRQREKPQLLTREGDAIAGPIAISSDLRQVVTVTDQKTVRLWVMGQSIVEAYHHDAPITCIRFSSDGTLIASGGEDKQVILWNPITKQQIALSHADRVTDVNFSPDSQTLVSVDSSGNVKLWDRHGTPLQTLNLQNSPLQGSSIQMAQFTPDGTAIVASTSDGRIILWNLNPKSLLQQGCSLLKKSSANPAGSYLCP